MLEVNSARNLVGRLFRSVLSKLAIFKYSPSAYTYLFTSKTFIYHFINILDKL